LNVPVPTMRAVYACAKMLDEKRSTARASRGETHQGAPQSADTASVTAPAGQSTEALR